MTALLLTALDHVLNRGVHLPGQISEKAEHRESGENSGREIQQRHKQCFAVKRQR